MDKLRKALEKIACFDDKGANEHLAETGSYGRFDEPGSVQIARQALTIEEDGGWVSVEERLPDVDQWVSVFPHRDPKEPAVGWRERGEGRWMCMTDMGMPYYTDVTHWQPLPKPPPLQ